MQQSCHRCGADLPSGDSLTSFCPHCGAPQLQLTEDYLASFKEGQPSPGGGTGSTGTLPPPLPRQVDWQAAIRCSAFVAAVAAVLSVVALRVPGVSLLSTLWILTASTTTLALYRRLRPLAWMDAAVGARIGLTTGLALIVLLSAALAAAGLVARFGLHAMAAFDAGYAARLAQARQAAIQATAQAAASASAPTEAEVLRLYDLPEFQAGVVLATAAIGSLLLLLFSAFGGAVNGLLRTRRRARL